VASGLLPLGSVSRAKWASAVLHETTNLFQLQKWYFDLVTTEGTAFLGYAARLRLGPFPFTYRATLISDPVPAQAASRASADSEGGGGAPPASHAHTAEQYTLRSSPDPDELDSGVVTWGCPPLALEGRWDPTTPALTRRLLDDSNGTIDWACLAPGAEAEVTVGGRRLKGLGYVEVLSTTVPPTKLPLDTIIWGRFLGPGTSIVWIEWRGRHPQHRVMVNGADQPAASLVCNGSGASEAVELPGMGARLELGAPRVIREGPLLDILSVAPKLSKRIPGDVGQTHERKLLSEGVFSFPGGAPIHGWAIHEVVKWRSAGQVP